MTRKNLSLLVAFAIPVVLAACASPGDDGPSEGDSEDATSFEQPFTDVEAYPLFVNSEITVGKNRMLIGLLDDNDAPIGSPDIDVHVRYFDLQPEAPQAVAEDDPEFVWSVEGSTGVYVGEGTFEHAGRWGAEVTISGDGLDETVRTSFDVREEATTPALGERVPASDTPTVRDVEALKEISTDPDPAPRFYRLSVAQALAKGRPFVLTFATPKFCQTAVCGPTLDVVKEVGEGFPELTFIHVEPYELPAEPPDFEIVPAVKEWGLPSEPWVFVVDGRGKLAHKFEGVVGSDELRHALRSL